jgi:hypothetical protein
MCELRRKHIPTIYRHLKSLEKDKIVRHIKQLGSSGSPPKHYYSKTTQINIMINYKGITAYYHNSNVSGNHMMQFRKIHYAKNMH